MQIRKATLSDAAGLVKLGQTMGYEVSEVDIRARLKKILARNDHVLVVGKDEDEVVGFCHGYSLVLVEVPEAIEVGGLAVLEEWQGKGVGKELLNAIEKWAKRKGFFKIVLSSNILRVKAHGFYEHMGYVKNRQQYAFEKTLT